MEKKQALSTSRIDFPGTISLLSSFVYNSLSPFSLLKQRIHQERESRGFMYHLAISGIIWEGSLSWGITQVISVYEHICGSIIWFVDIRKLAKHDPEQVSQQGISSMVLAVGL